ncbi:energy transducer TonB [Granulicella sp. S190]|uniref:energy transducer TonB n=1 Tax=Granulicella sp. S190 TaxID=1747226 RepID=UPI00131A8DB4|nr:energy transducer TonB [Granulicella sp. S190]
MRTVWAFFALLLAAPVCITLHAQSRPLMVPPRLISVLAPDCRSGKACHGEHGHVRLIVDILEDGKVGDIKVELGNATLADAATLAVQQAEFLPGYFQGKPQSMDFVVNLRF